MVIYSNKRNNDEIDFDNTVELIEKKKASHKRVLFLAAAAAVVIAVIVALAWHNIAVTKKYEGSIALAEKGLLEGNYEQAEAGYLEAVGIKPKEAKPREGLAFTYALEEKYDASYQEYADLYNMTQDDKYSLAMDAVSASVIPEDESLVPVEGIWLEVNPDSIPDIEMLENYISNYLSIFSIISRYDESGDIVEKYGFSDKVPQESYVLPMIQLSTDIDVEGVFETGVAPDPREWGVYG